MAATHPTVDAIVTGGAGFIGSHLVERLLRDGRSVAVIDNFSTGHDHNLAGVAGHPRLAIHRESLATWPGLEDRMRRAGVVFHLAASVGVDLVLQNTSHALLNNQEATTAVLRAASRQRTPIIIASSSEVYGRSPREILCEDDEPTLGPPSIGRWSYACSKLMGEYLALALHREHPWPVTVARIFNTVGPRQTGRHGMVLPRFIDAARSARPLPVHGDGRQTRCFCAVEDTVEALVRLERTPAASGAVVNVGNDEPTAILDLARLVLERVARRTGRAAVTEPSIEFVPYGKAYPTPGGFEELPRRRPNIQRLFELTGFKPARGLPEIIDALLIDS